MRFLQIEIKGLCRSRPNRPYRVCKVRVSEIFYSLQGEGFLAGVPSVFVRLAGCPLRCKWCDTKYAWDDGRELSPDAILEKIHRLRRRFAAKWICLTGGEPLAQNIGTLVVKLKEAGLSVQIETNGTFSPTPKADWYTLSPKPPEYSFHPGYLKKAKEIKLVVSRRLRLAAIRTLREAFPRSTPILLQPQDNAVWSMKKGKRLLEEGLRENLSNIRLSIQLHKILGIR